MGAGTGPKPAGQAEVEPSRERSQAGSVAGPGRLRSACPVEMGRVVGPEANRAVVTVFDHAVGVVPLMIAAVGRPFLGNTSINEEPRQMSAKARPPPVPTAAQVAHRYNLTVEVVDLREVHRGAGVVAPLMMPAVST